MSAFTIISDITVEIRRRIFDSLQTAPGVTLNLTHETSNILLSPPEDSNDANARLSLYLYHIGVNGSARNQRLLPQPGRTDELRLPPLPLELRYLATPLDDEENNQLMLSRLLQFVYDQPHIDTVNGAPLGDSFGGGSPKLRVTPDLMTLEQLTQLWNAFNQPLRLSIAFKVDVVALDSAKEPRVAPRVVDAWAVTGSGERNP